MVVVTIPQKNVPQLGAKQRISQLPKDSIVIDTGNYVRSHALHSTPHSFVVLVAGVLTYAAAHAVVVL